EDCTPGSDVGARDIELDAGDARHAVQHPRDSHVLVNRLAGHVDHDRHLPARPHGRLLAYDHTYAGVLQADGVQHPTRGLGKAWWGRTALRSQRSPFGEDGAETLYL